MKFCLLLFTVFAVTISAPAYSQEYYVGIKGGLNQSYLKSSDEGENPELEKRNAFNLAGVLFFPINKSIGISWELGYTMKGTQTDDSSINYKFHYLSSPVLFDYMPTQKLKVSVGPEISRLGKAYNHTNDSTKVNMGDTYNKNWELSGTVGASYSLAYFMDLGVRYNAAFTKSAAYDPLLNRRNLYNQYVQIFLMLKVAN